MGVGAPSKFSAEIGDEICRQISEGATLRTICKGEGMPDPRTVYRWLEKRERFRQQYARARADQADSFHDEALETARGTNATNAQADRLRVDTLKWAAAHAQPKKYGARVGLEVAAPDGGPVRVQHGLDADPDRLAALATLLGEIRGGA